MFNALPWILALSSMISFYTFSDLFQENGQPEELGKVRWIRDFEIGIQKAKEENKAIFLLFQEVPGCATCRNYGHNVLSNPLIVEAIESLFIPVAIYNNKGGKDAEVLRYYKEPAWNNPVVRIVGDDKKDKVQRVSGNYSELGVVQAMTTALVSQGQEVPRWLSLLQEELQAKSTGTSTATFSMFCFWTGEKNFGEIEGVISTEAGFMSGREVVRLAYDPTQISYESLIQEADKKQSASHIFVENNQQRTIASKKKPSSKISDKSSFRLDREPKYFLSKTVYRYVPMTDLQATRANSLIGAGESPDPVLSERQKQIKNFVQTNPELHWENAINVTLAKAWTKFEEERSKVEP